MHIWLLGEDLPWSPAPALMRAVFEHLGLSVTYTAQDIPSSQLPALLNELRGGGVAGCHVAAPYRRPLARACDELLGDAAVLESVDCLVVRDGRIIGEAHSPFAVELGLSLNKMWPRPGATVVVVGAGEIGRAAVVALRRVPCDRILVISHRAEAIADLADRFSDGGSVRAVPWEGRAVANAVAGAQLVINCTSAPLESLPYDVHDLPGRCTVADVRFMPQPTPLVAVASETHRRSCDGTDMFLYQQLLALRDWGGIEPPWEMARATLRRVIAHASQSSAE